jgi:hypothetical protein
MAHATVKGTEVHYNLATLFPLKRQALADWAGHPLAEELGRTRRGWRPLVHGQREL